MFIEIENKICRYFNVTQDLLVGKKLLWTSKLGKKLSLVHIAL